MITLIVLLSSAQMLGFCPVEKLLREGCAVGIGTDGAPSNNRMNLLDEMFLASLINKGRHAIYTGSTSPEALPAETVIEMVRTSLSCASLRGSQNNML
jgi:cytosine/adenosine deaminase-related metal-dependent hydrolase